MRRYLHGKTKAEIDHDIEKARESGMKFDTAPSLSKTPWQDAIARLGEAYKRVDQETDPQFAPEP